MSNIVSEFDNWYADSFITADDPVQTAQQAGFGQRQGTSYNPDVGVCNACKMFFVHIRVKYFDKKS